MNMIWVTTQKEMLHCYPDAPDDVSFLRNEHRHIFHFKVSIEVFHNDRDIEFIQFKRLVDSWLTCIDKCLKEKSCEMLSDRLYEHINIKYPDRDVHIEVSEDRENGSFKTYPKS